MAEDKRNQIIVWMGAVVFVSLMFMLMYQHDDQQVKAALTFSELAIGSLAFIAFVELMEMFMKKSTGLWKFWTANISKKNIMWLGFSIAGVFLFSYIGGTTGNPLMGLIGSGLVMGFALWKSKSIIIPFIAHGTYNVVILELGKAGLVSNSFIAHSAIPVAATNSNVILEILWQFFLVASSEELLKLAAIVWALFLIRGMFNTKSEIADALAIIFGVIIWTLFHIFTGSLYLVYH